MNLDHWIHWFGWAALTYCWLTVNVNFCQAIEQAIRQHNDAIKRKSFNEGLEACKKYHLVRQPYRAMQKESDDDEES